MQEITFFDIETQKYFKTEIYEVRDIGGRKFAIADSPSKKNKCWFVLKDIELKFNTQPQKR